jgi:hypothetical protein
MEQRNAQHFVEQKSILSAITHKLNACRHMLIWTFFFWYVELTPKVHPHLSVTRCICNIGEVKMGLKEIGCEVVGWFPLTPERKKEFC